MINKSYLILIGLVWSWAVHAEPSIDYIREHAIPTQGEQVPLQLIRDVSDKRLLLLGEFHGTKQMPLLAAQILEGLSGRRRVALGVEFPKELQPAVDRFMLTGNEDVLRATDFFKDIKYGSGRTTMAMLDLLRAARKLKVPVFCFDIPYQAEGDGRDTAMAENVLAYLQRHPHHQIVTYSGNLHSRLDGKYMGAEILRLSRGKLTEKNSDNLVFWFGSGTLWNCIGDPGGVIDCGIHHATKIQDNYSAAISADFYYLPGLEPHVGHNKTFYIRAIMASLPLNTFRVGCEIDGPVLQEFLAMDYKSFDQTLPDGGWRGIAHQGCDLEAAKLVDLYNLQNSKSLTNGQSRVLYWHAGQLYGFSDLIVLAINLFKSSINPEEPPNDDFKWNAYVNGSIAFLEGKKEELQHYRDELVSAPSPNAKVNLRILNNMLTCMGQSYLRAYSAPCDK